MRLSAVLREYRWATRQSARDLAKEIGVSAATLSRIEHGHDPDGKSLALVLRWLLAGD